MAGADGLMRHALEGVGIALPGNEVGSDTSVLACLKQRAEFLRTMSAECGPSDFEFREFALQAFEDRHDEFLELLHVAVPALVSRKFRLVPDFPVFDRHCKAACPAMREVSYVPANTSAYLLKSYGGFEL